MNIFTRHPMEQGFAYGEHLAFAMGIAGRLLRSVLAFALHAVLPFIPIEPQLDLEATAAFLEAMNRWIAATSGRRRAGAAHESTAPLEQMTYLNLK